MKIISQKKSIHIIKLAKGEEFIQIISSFCRDNGITFAYISAIGACDRVTLSWYDLKNKKYIDETYSEGLEITNLTGNISRFGDKLMIHAHGTFARRDFNVIGGHIKEMVVSATCEIRLEDLEASVSRKFDQETGLNLLE